MGQLSQRLIPDIKSGDPRYTARMERMLNEPRKLTPAAKQNLTTLHVLVQNRCKDNIPVLLFGGCAQVVTKASGTKDALCGRMGAEDDITPFTRNGSVFQVPLCVKSSWMGTALLIAKSTLQSVLQEILGTMSCGYT